MTRSGVRGGGLSGTAVSVRFTEEMRGHVTFGERDFAAGSRGATALMFHLTIAADPVDRFVADPRHEARARGYVLCEELGGRLPVEQGTFNLFVEEGDPGMRRMLYLLHFRDAVGHPLTLTGYKVVRRRHLPPFDVWPDTTTLYTRVLRGFVDAVDATDADVVASGILRITMPGFARQLTTFRTQGPTRGRRLRGLLGFDLFFAGQLRRVYLGLHRRRSTPASQP